MSTFILIFVFMLVTVVLYILHFIVLLFAAVTSLHKNMVSVHFILVFLLLLRGDSTEASSAEVSDCFKVNKVTLATIIANECDLKPEVCVIG